MENNICEICGLPKATTKELDDCWSGVVTLSGRCYDVMSDCKPPEGWRSAYRKLLKQKNELEQRELTAEELSRVAAEATREAHRRAFDVVDKILIARDGWLVYIDRDGNVIERVKKIGE